MLARTFKTATELGIPEHEANALQTVLYMLEDGEIKPELVFMGTFTEHLSCGTAHCLAGWAHEIDKQAFPELGKRGYSAHLLQQRLPAELSLLFGIENCPMAGCTAAGATASLRYYLETGICNRK